MSSHNNNSTSANDPRQPSAAKPYVAQPVSPQDLPVDYSGFIAVIFGIAGVMFRVLPLPLDLSSYKLSSWLAIIFCAQSLANMKNVENDLKQISMAMMVPVQGFCMLPFKVVSTRLDQLRYRSGEGHWTG
ncbi:hypothetical protein Goari_007072 [Gossypium aridum]|uniref:Protein Asterix n=1 Tax=Gossypium aridum TaxID=34290 RepID=A0A7J8XQJ7_GOSAI|nr:hypothetical protein [Gossypium aridum]